MYIYVHRDYSLSKFGMREELTQDSIHYRQNCIPCCFAPFQDTINTSWVYSFEIKSCCRLGFLYLTLSCCPVHMSCRALPLFFTQHQGQPHHLYLKLKLGGEAGPRGWRKHSDHAEKLSLWGGRNANRCGNRVLLVASVGMCVVQVCASVALNWLGKGQCSSGNPAGIFARSTPQSRCFCLPAVLRAVRTVLAYSDHGIADTPAHPLHTHLSRYTHPPLLSARTKNQISSWSLRWEHIDIEIK